MYSLIVRFIMAKDCPFINVYIYIYILKSAKCVRKTEEDKDE